MFKNLIAALAGGRLDTLPADEAQLALGALLVRVAKSDGNYAFEEIRQIDHILADRFDLNPVEAAQLRTRCQKLEAQAPATAEFVQAVKPAIPFAERSAWVAAMWKVVLADGNSVNAEESAFRQVASALGIDTTDLR
ncbi:MAG: TerB family tellurite resistance protein [Paracoccaceae bacterium]